MPQPWSFQQLGGERKLLTLAGKAAPHGRPRRAPVVKDGTKLRRERVYYPDTGGPPTTHIFGIMHHPWELKGRFMDKDLGSLGAAKQLVLAWKRFLKDGQPVLITWGDVLEAEGFIDEFEAGRESENEVEYTIKIEIDSIPLEGGEVATLPASPEQICSELQKEMTEGLGAAVSERKTSDMSPDFLESLESIVSSANAFSATLLNIAGEFDTFTTGTIDQLERLRAGAHQCRTAVLKIRGTIETTDLEFTLLARDADAEVQWFAQRAALDVSTMRTLSLLDELDLEVEIAQAGQGVATVTARLGDTWESLSTQFFGGPSFANRMRDANGARYGEQPVPGRTYLVPTP